MSETAGEAAKKEKRAPIRAAVDIGSTLKDNYTVSICPQKHVHVEVQHPGNRLITDIAFVTPEDVWDFAQLLLKGYDQLTGIASE